MSGSTVLDSAGSWNGVAYGGYSTSSGNLALDGSSGYVDLGSHTVSGKISYAFWGRIDSSLVGAYDKAFFSFQGATDSVYFGISGGGADAASATSMYF